jgi:uncharacterized membrane protein YphA (DoxX/SURF4 family)
MPRGFYKKSRFLLSALRWSLAGVFAWAAIAKLLHSSDSQSTIFTTFVGGSNVRRVGAVVCEFALALCILMPWWTRRAALIALVILSTFCGTIIFEATREMPLPCGCIGATAAVGDPTVVRRSLWMGLGVNLVLMAGAYTLAATPGKREST